MAITTLATSLSALVLLASLVSAQSAVYGQCGGTGWTGPTTCVSGSVCTYSNPYYSQCLPGTASSGSSSSASSSTASSGATPTISGGLPGATGTGKLHTVAKAAGKTYFGSATDNPELTDSPYVAILSDNTMFGQITPGNSWKWDATEPSRGTFTFTAGDAILSLAQKNSQLLRGHNCVWYNQLPSWVTSGNFDAATLQSIITTHCSTIVGHYKGDTYSWDVVNEPFNDDGTWRTDVFYNTLNTSYVATALNAAKSADSATKLYINDYNIETAGAKSTAMQNLVKSLKSAGTPIDGVGVQGHLIVGEVSSMTSNLAAFTALGVEVAITELDIRMTLPATAALYAQQKTDYQTVISSCQAVAECIGVTIWDYTDKYSWVPATFSGQGGACPWDASLLKKPAFDGIVNGFQS
ncbi:glycoside hydrolase family 10 protein [Auriscalpium vulgare]|uniref:Glycoside hydrolase family 10 protein n=1 Tax=Auriscalpium vulgare TaxID=40419 RepID=A0ACB8RRW6_9AGAM|nr:glycoside hydrolase family 10 protein [Auriscalpium vulgare]